MGSPSLKSSRKQTTTFTKFAPAVLIVNNVKTGMVFRAGEINVEALEKSLGL